ncbi:MAG: NAD-dependent epimerase/dehydratase family protein [Alphaproteobacteria bacterium]|nr:NAD-dependent epimerase/dehydratase family protein [Alphaproteobacteria bacterium]
MLDGYSAPELLRAAAVPHTRRLYLVTGGCGFIGSHLVEALTARGDTVRVFDDLSHGRRENLQRGVEFIEGDVADPMALRRAIQDVDGCFHLAAVPSVVECQSRWLEAHRTNLTGTINVFDAARRAQPGRPVPVVYASSSAIYGNRGAVPLGEALPPQPLSICGADKAGCELHARIAHAAHGIPTVGLRLFNVFGPRQPADCAYPGVVPSFLARLAAGRPVSIFGDGGHVRDFVFVRDAVAALLAAMGRAAADAEIFNVCTGRGVSVLALARLAARLVAVEPEIAFLPARPSDVRHSVGDPTCAARGLGFMAATDLETGLGATLRALRTVDAI